MSTPSDAMNPIIAAASIAAAAEQKKHKESVNEQAAEIRSMGEALQGYLSPGVEASVTVTSKDSTSATPVPADVGKYPNSVTLSDTLDEIKAGTERRKELEVENKDDINAFNTANENKIIAIKRQGEADQVVKKAESTAEMIRQQNYSDYVDIVEGSDFELTNKLTASYITASDKVRKKQDELNKLYDVDVAKDGFMPWLRNYLFVIPETRNELAAAKDKANAIVGELQNINTLKDSRFKTLANLKKTKTAAVIAAELKSSAETTNILAAKSMEEASLINAQAVARAYTMSQDQVQASITAYTLEANAEQRALNSESIKLQLKNAKDSEEMEDIYVKGVGAAYKKFGMPFYEGTDEAKLKEQKSIILTEASIQKDKFDKLFMYGIGTNTLTPYEVINAYAAGNSKALVEGDNTALNVLNDVANEAYEAALQDPELKLNPNQKGFSEAVEKEFYEKYYEKIGAYAELIDPDDASNPYRAQPLSELVKTTSVQSEPLVQLVLKPLLVGDIVDIPADEVFKRAVDAVKNRTITLDKAVKGFNAIYSQAANLNNRLYDFNALSMRPQDSYNVKITDKTLGFKQAYLERLQNKDLTSIGLFGLAVPGLTKGKKAFNAMDYNETAKVFLTSLNVIRREKRKSVLDEATEQGTR